MLSPFLSASGERRQSPPSGRSPAPAGGQPEAAGGVPERLGQAEEVHRVGLQHHRHELGQAGPERPEPPGGCAGPSRAIERSQTPCSASYLLGPLLGVHTHTQQLQINNHCLPFVEKKNKKVKILKSKIKFNC